MRIRPRIIHLSGAAHALALLALVTAAHGCMGDNGVPCADGYCLAGWTCQEEICLRPGISPGCGNGLPDFGEACDDGNNTNGDGCSEDCLSNESCGNGIADVAAGEDCDDGGGDSAACDSDCTMAICGDGHANPAAGEACDDGGDSAACDIDCTMATCARPRARASAYRLSHPASAPRQRTPPARTDCRIPPARTGCRPVRTP
jgi:cysteine-rich repeat protein